MFALLDIAVEESEFLVVHSQSFSADIVFLVLFVSYIFFVVTNSDAFLNIVNHPVRVDSDVVGNTYYVKYGSFVWAKAMLVMSIPVMQSPYEKFTPFIPWLMLGMLAVMLVRAVAPRMVGYLSDRDSQFAAVKYSSDCQVILLVCLATPPLLVAYCLGMFYEIAWVILAVYGIYHIIRVIKLLSGIGFSFFNVFLYLCGVEFLPLAVFVSGLKLMQ